MSDSGGKAEVWIMSWGEGVTMALFVGLDVGTTSVSVVLLDACASSVVGARSLAHGAGRSGSIPGRAEVDLEAVWGVAQRLLAEVVCEAAGRRREVAGVGVTGQMHGLALVRPDGVPAATAISWQDQRAAERDASGCTYLERFVEQAGGPVAFERMGALPATGYLGPSLYRLLRDDGLPAPPLRACLIPDAMVARLTGAPPVTDPTDAASTGLYDMVAGGWDAGLLTRLGIPHGLLAPVHASGGVAGGLARDPAERIGLPAGLPVAVGIGDNQASLIGSVRDAPGSLLANIGTGAQLSALVGAFARAPGLEARPFPDGRYLLVGAGLFGGASYALLRDLYRRVGGAFFGALSDEELYDRMNELASAVPSGSEGLRCAPLFSGTRADPAVRGSLTGVSDLNLTPGHLARALLEGIAEQLYGLYDAMRPVAGARTGLVGAGNAIARNALLARILAARFGLPLHLPAFDEPAAAGAALVAATAVGAFDDIDAAMASALRYREVMGPHILSAA